MLADMLAAKRILDKRHPWLKWYLPLAPGIDAGWVPVLSRVFSQLGEQRDHVAVAAAVRPLLPEPSALPISPPTTAPRMAPPPVEARCAGMTVSA